MKVLLVGGTGLISEAVVAELLAQKRYDVYLLNRGTHKAEIPGVTSLIADIEDEAWVQKQLKGMSFDVVADFIVFRPEQALRDIRLFAGKTKQYIFVSSASAYQKPLLKPWITESTPLCNPYWQYSRDKIACEDIFMKEYRENGFPVTIVRPSHTYSYSKLPFALNGKTGSWPVLKRLLEGKPVLIHGDGTSLWTITHNTDFAKGFAGLFGHSGAIGEAVHITSDEAITWNRIYDIVASALGVEAIKFHVASDYLAACDPELRGGLLGDKAESVLFDNTKIKSFVPGYQATTRFDVGAKITVDYLLAHPEEQLEDPDFDRFCDKIIEEQKKARAFMAGENY